MRGFEEWSYFWQKNVHEFADSKKHIVLKIMKKSQKSLLFIVVVIIIIVYYVM